MAFSKVWILRNLYIRVKYFRPRHAARLISVAMRILREDSIRKILWTTKQYIIHGSDYSNPNISDYSKFFNYQTWIKKNEKWNITEIKKEIEGFNYNPKISIITPVYNVNPIWLEKCIESVRNQFYENWELCLHDDASTKAETVDCLKKWQEKGDTRIKISFGKENQHISGASNEALKMATGEFIALLDNDDELAPNALFENVKLLNGIPRSGFRL